MSTFCFLSISYDTSDLKVQCRRYLIAAILAVLPISVANVSPVAFSILQSIVIGLIWTITYPLQFYISYKDKASIFNAPYDPAFGLYFIAWETSLLLLTLLIPNLSASILLLVSIVQIFISLLLAFQWLYFGIYRLPVQSLGLQALLETDINEVIFYIRYTPLLYKTLAFLAMFALPTLISYINFTYPPTSTFFSTEVFFLYLLLTIGIGIYLWKKNGLFSKTSFITTYLLVRSFRQDATDYTKKLCSKLSKLRVSQKRPLSSNHPTVVLIIGESASRDYMKSFNTDFPLETTPWLSRKKQDKNFILFDNPYSSISQTAPALAAALTEMNQYHDASFSDACSIIDIAHKLGFFVRWYSNQGHFGAEDTTASLIAETADIAKWTVQTINTTQYDEELLDFLPEIDPSVANFVVFHLMGSHEKYKDRYPDTFSEFDNPEISPEARSYATSILYTDSIIQRIFDECSRSLQLDALIYLSDHGSVPGSTRHPCFNGFDWLRIPLFVYLSDSYIESHRDTYEAMLANKSKYWTNDLTYELLCSILDIQSNHFNESNSLASKSYKHKKEDLLVQQGTIKLTD